MNSSNNTQQEMYNILCKLSGEQVISTITDFLGMQILTDDFAKHLIDDGLANESDFSELFEEEEDDDEEEEENEE